MKEEKETHIPVETCFRFHKIKLLQAFGITILNAFAFYILMIYTTTYFNRILGYSMAKSTAINLYMVSLTLILIPFTGLLSDIIGRKKVLGISAVGFIILDYPIDLFFVSKPSLLFFMLGQTVICILLAIFGGTTPLLVTYFIEQTSIITIPGILLTVSAIISLMVILSCQETYKIPLR